MVIQLRFCNRPIRRSSCIEFLAVDFGGYFNLAVRPGSIQKVVFRSALRPGDREAVAPVILRIMVTFSDRLELRKYFVCFGVHSLAKILLIDKFFSGQFFNFILWNFKLNLPQEEVGYCRVR